MLKGRALRTEQIRTKIKLEGEGMNLRLHWIRPQNVRASALTSCMRMRRSFCDVV